MNAAQVTGPADVPHRDGFAVTGGGCHGVCLIATMAITKRVCRLGGSSPEFGEIDHSPMCFS